MNVMGDVGRGEKRAKWVDLRGSQRSLVWLERRQGLCSPNPPPPLYVLLAGISKRRWRGFHVATKAAASSTTVARVVIVVVVCRWEVEEVAPGQVRSTVVQGQ